MKRVFCLAAVAALGCATHGSFDYSGLVRVMGHSTIGHACPVGPTTLLTSTHLVHPSAVRWSDFVGTNGITLVLGSDPRSDISVLQTDRTLLRWFEIAEQRPKAGTKVIILGYKWKTAELRPLVLSTVVRSTHAGHVFYDESPGQGSSGSCVIDKETLEVYAINESKHSKYKWGKGVAVWGKWNPLQNSTMRE